MQKLHNHFSTRKTPQSEPIPTTDQVKNNAGGYAWQIDKWAHLDRFLILGTEGGTYYSGEAKLTRDNANAVLECIKEYPIRVIRRIVEISDGGRAVSNDPALFALAMCCKLDNRIPEEAYKVLPKVARIGTHLFHFLEYCKAFGGLGGSGFKRAIARWYNEKEAEQLAYQVIKYQQRDGWSHRDALRLAHPKAPSEDHQSIYKYVTKGRENDMVHSSAVPQALKQIWAWETAKELDATHEGSMCDLIDAYRLPHECVPNHFKKSPAVWEALLQKMPLGALVRNLGKLTSLGLIHNTSEHCAKACALLTNGDAINKARLHPMSILVAMCQYAAGQGFRGSLTWQPASRIMDALDQAFYLAFHNVNPTGKRLCIALDVSASMWAPISGALTVSCRAAAAAMALVTARTEQMWEMVAFTGSMGWAQPHNTTLKVLDFSPRERLDDIVRKTSNLQFGRTDCALPMLWAQQMKRSFDAFLIYTDNETWCGDIHPSQALQQYRSKMGINAKLAVIAMTSAGFSIADPRDAGMMDFVGFDTSTPQAISQFLGE